MDEIAARAQAAVARLIQLSTTSGANAAMARRSGGRVRRSSGPPNGASTTSSPARAAARARADRGG